MFISESLSISDPVLAFDRIMEEIEIKQHLKSQPFHKFLQKIIAKT